MKTKENKSNGKRDYIVTCDLAERFAQLKNMGMKTPDLDEFFGEFDETLVKLVKRAYPEDNVLVYNVHDLAHQILETAIEKQKETRGVIVSTCVDFAIPQRGAILEINRIVNEKGDIIGIGPRPGHLPLEEQFTNVVNIAGKRPIILVEDGIFSGKTLSCVVQGLKERGVEIECLIVGFSLKGGMEELEKIYDGEVISIKQINDFIDWMPDHDFFPFAPNCGRVLGIKMNGSTLPFYNQNGISYSIPYILPFAPMEEWTSIPKEFNFKISYFAMERACEFYSALDKMNGGVKIKDVIGGNPRISAPVTVEPKVFPTIHEKIGRILHGIHAECW
jgi:hypothetical protein